ncbi:ThiF family adenylyltransferase [Corynebacterium mayonis]|uniref:ThiF family adenylyltransferase n=1 Tax=Corynebacterium mayonis TaxID=3062461 RepID=UPI00313FF1A7
MSPQRTLLPHDELRRTARHMNLPGFGLKQQEKLYGAHVFVIGAGGLGCPVMQSLAAMGVGTITVIDDDVVSLTNIHRQILFTAADVGRPKVDVTAERLAGLQPGITINALRARLTADNALAMLRGVDVLVDGSDTFSTKYLAADAAEITGTPLVWGSVLRYRGDVALWWSGPGAPVDGAGMRDLYPDQPAADAVPDCATAGVLGVTTSVVGGLMATEVVKHLTGLGDSQPGKLHIYDALTTRISHFTVTPDPARPPVTSLGFYGTPACRGKTWGRQLIDTADALIDVREIHEKALQDLHRPGELLPTSQWEQQPGSGERLLRDLRDKPAQNVLVYCASGVRSERFVERFSGAAAKLGLTLSSLPGGTNEHGVDLER